MIDEYYTWLIYGYHSDDLKPYSHKYVVTVCDGCSLYNSMSMDRYSRTSDLCKSCVQIGKKYPKRTPEQNVAQSNAALAPNPPLPDGWESKLSAVPGNKSSSVYLGIMAEVILSNIYDNVQVMPTNNHGYDIICNRDKMIDIKASATGYKGVWKFTIRKNQIADFFLCIAFESRDDLFNPVHLWMIPGHKINHLGSIRIYKTTLDKWSKYELPLDKLVACCDNLNNAKERNKQIHLYTITNLKEK